MLTEPLFITKALLGAKIQVSGYFFPYGNPKLILRFFSRFYFRCEVIKIGFTKPQQTLFSLKKEIMFLTLYCFSLEYLSSSCQY